MTWKFVKVFKDTITGRFVSKKEVQERPETTMAETTKRPAKK